MKKTYWVNISDNESHIVVVPRVIVPHHRSAMSVCGHAPLSSCPVMYIVIGLSVVVTTWF